MAIDPDNGPSSRKIRAFIVLAVAVVTHTALVTFARTPEVIAINSLWAISIGEFITIGGQSIVDSIEKWKPTISSQVTTVVENKNVTTTEKKD